MRNVSLKGLIVAVAGLSAGQVFADGFVCLNAEESLKVKVYNETSPDMGTRNAAIMVLSNPQISVGRKTIATFRADDTLSNSGAQYKAITDARYAELGKRGEYIGGTRLGEVKAIKLNVKFTYELPMEDGEATTGVLTITKKDGEVLEHDMNCVRYLKGE